MHTRLVLPDTVFIRRWEDLRFPASGINPAGSPAPPTVDTGDPFAGTLLFSPTITNVIAGIAQLPHAWMEGTTLDAHVHWCPTNTDTGNVAWRFSYNIADINGTFGAAYTTPGIVLSAGTGTTRQHVMKDVAAISMTGFHISAVISWKLERVGGDGSDTYNADARFLELDFHYQLDSFGSRQELVK